MRALATLVIFVCVSRSVAHAASFAAKDITKFGRAHDALAKSAVFDEAGDDDGFSLSDLNPVDGLGGMFGDAINTMISPSGEFILHRTLAAAVPYATANQAAEMERIAADAGFASVDEWAEISDAVTGAVFALQFAPVLEELDRDLGASKLRERASEVLKKRGAEEARRRATQGAIGAILKGRGLEQEAIDAILNSGGSPADTSMEEELRAIITEEVARNVGGQMMMSSTFIKRMTALVAFTPEADIALIKKNVRRLPRDMRPE
ncbi:MAG: hypothetical protein AAF527_06805 [Pseudomonadota bacterium]